jgi:hypothetical protein
VIVHCNIISPDSNENWNLYELIPHSVLRKCVLLVLRSDDSTGYDHSGRGSLRHQCSASWHWCSLETLLQSTWNRELPLSWTYLWHNVYIKFQQFLSIHTPLRKLKVKYVICAWGRLVWFRLSWVRLGYVSDVAAQKVMCSGVFILPYYMFDPCPWHYPLWEIYGKCCYEINVSYPCHYLNIKFY